MRNMRKALSHIPVMILQSHLTKWIPLKCIQNVKYGIAGEINGQTHFDLTIVDHSKGK